MVRAPMVRRGPSAAAARPPASRTSFASNDPTATLLRWGPKPDGRPDELGGGLNNMLMNLGQLINDVCPGGKKPTATLVLPNLTAGWRFFQPGQLGRRNVRSLRFGEVFDAEHFIWSIRPCLAVARVEDARRSRTPLTILPAHLEPINAKYKYNRLLPLVYRALRPGPAVAALVASHVERARAGAGPRWSAVHLRIERDWWVQSGFCRRSPRRCFPPDEVARIVAKSRAIGNSSGAVLIYAADNLDPQKGPVVRRAAFGEATTQLSHSARDTAYTIRAASEFFAAAAAPGGFYGNSYSTFSRGVALLRWAHANRNLTRIGQRGVGLGLSKGDKETLVAMGVPALTRKQPGVSLALTTCGSAPLRSRWRRHGARQPGGPITGGRAGCRELRVRLRESAGECSGVAGPGAGRSAAEDSRPSALRCRPEGR